MTDGDLPTGALASKHLLGIEDMSRADANLILDTARSFGVVNQRNLKKVPVLRGRTIVNLFFEASTRTRLSFEIATKRLSADGLNFTGSSSSLTKGETLLDTARNIEAMKPDITIVRHNYAGAAHMLTKVVAGAVVNAGDGLREHPTQALLDAYTLLTRWGRSAADGLHGKTITIVGDIAHSRVARSNMLLLPLLGATVRVIGPRTMMPPGLDQYTVEPMQHMERALKGAHAVMMLRIQKERIKAPLMSTDREYAMRFGLTKKRAALLDPETLIMHPGPINRGVEMAPEVADSLSSVILEQAENGVSVRMAVLYLLALGLAREEA
jgi:aspartate carbamoyltransferase catalytic subunit